MKLHVKTNIRFSLFQGKSHNWLEFNDMSVVILIVT